jgi:hypothetical protein
VHILSVLYRLAKVEPMDQSQKLFQGAQFYPRVYVREQWEGRLWVRSSPLNWKREELQLSLSLELESRAKLGLLGVLADNQCDLRSVLQVGCWR